jgi:ornithine racemase
MLARATLTIDLAKIEENARRVVEALPGVGIVGVTKVTCASPEIARAMLAGGVTALGESRLENAQRLRDAGIEAPIWLLRAPTPALANNAVRLVDVSAISELAIAEALDAAAGRAGCRHGILAMVDIGDRREGMMPDELPEFLSAVEAMGHVDLIGIGASLTCYGAIVPDATNLGLLASLSEAAEKQLGRALIVSGGSSTSIDLVAHGHGPSAIDNLRIGEAIILGVDPATRLPIPGLALHTDALTLAAPIVECKVKPSLPTGCAAQDAFGTTPSFVDRGDRLRAICAIGRQDAPAEGLIPLDPRVEVLGASSDHLVVDVDELSPLPAIGDTIEFRPGYSATLGVFTSPYVEKRFV